MKSYTATIAQSSSTLSSSLSLSSSSAAPSSSQSTSSTWSSPFTMRHFILSLVLLALYTSSVSQACFIRNCPKGGKRGLDSVTLAHRPCISCGPGNVGQCVGPKICCSPQFGCHMGGPHAEVCQKENESSSPCYVQGDACGPRDMGKCVADGTCCDSETCTMADECAAPVSDQRDQAQVLKLLERLLQAKSKDLN